MVSVAEKAGLSLALSENPEDRFSHIEAHFVLKLNSLISDFVILFLKSMVVISFKSLASLQAPR